MEVAVESAVKEEMLSKGLKKVLMLTAYLVISSCLRSGKFICFLYGSAVLNLMADKSDKDSEKNNARRKYYLCEDDINIC